MTATRSVDQASWNTMPGWGIVVDLTPPELLARRRLHVLRRLIVVALAFVVLATAGGYAWALNRSSAASDRADAAAAQTARLRADANQYAGVTTIESTVDRLKVQVATALANDVDTPKLVTDIRNALPASMTIDNLSISLVTNGAASVPTTGLDRSGQVQIGTVNVTGTATDIDGLPDFVDRLSTVSGVINVVPTSNIASDRIVRYALIFGITAVRYSHHYDAARHGSK